MICHVLSNAVMWYGVSCGLVWYITWLYDMMWNGMGCCGMLWCIVRQCMIWWRYMA